MAEEKKERWLGWLALSTVILAVCATLSTFKGGGYSTRALLCQTQASDQWAFYQAKSIKGYLYEVQKERLELERRLYAGSAPADLLGDFDAKARKYGEKIAQYDKEKAGIMAGAKALEQERDEAKRHQAAFGIAVIFLQVAILLSSIAALMKRKLLWVASLVIGAYGLFAFANGFWLFL